MAATKTTPTTGVTFPKDLMGAKLRVFVMTDVQNGNTLDTGIEGIVRVSWTPTGTGDAVAVTNTDSVVTFNCPGTETGDLIIWSER